MKYSKKWCTLPVSGNEKSRTGKLSSPIFMEEMNETIKAVSNESYL